MSKKERIEKFTRETCKAFRIEFDAAVAKLAEKYNSKIGLGKIRFTDLEMECSVKVQLQTVQADGTILGPDAVEFREMAHLYGLKPALLFTTFRAEGEEFRITGLRFKRRRGEVIICTKLSDGQEWWFVPDKVRRALEMAPPTQPPADKAA